VEYATLFQWNGVEYSTGRQWNMQFSAVQGRAAGSYSTYIIFSLKNLEKSRTKPNNLRGKQRTVKYREEAWTKPNKAE